MKIDYLQNKIQVFTIINSYRWQ